MIPFMKNLHALHVFQPPCCLLEEVFTSWYTKLSGATVIYLCIASYLPALYSATCTLIIISKKIMFSTYIHIVACHLPRAPKLRWREDRARRPRTGKCLQPIGLQRMIQIAIKLPTITLNTRLTDYLSQ